MHQEPQFGAPAQQGGSRDRPAAFGILQRGADIALVRITLDDGTAPYVDLPGGAIDPGETAQQALVREFGEETGLVVTVGAPIGRARQYFVTSKGDAVNNLCAFFVVHDGVGSARKIEDDHDLVWAAPQAALALLRHDAHAWAICAWLRKETAR